ncbi:MAG: hypothetical protein LLF96_12935 [Eubacteriales bacterium]|nr:hypothetical protein [Eubacteriales bacterium]
MPGRHLPAPTDEADAIRKQFGRGECALIVTDYICTCKSLLANCAKQYIAAQMKEPVPGVWKSPLPRTFA